MWLEKKEFNEWIIRRCLELKRKGEEDTEKLWDTIDDEYFILEYLTKVEDKKEVRDKIKTSDFAFYYCLHVCDRKEMWTKIDNSYFAYQYCRQIKDRPELHKYFEIRGNYVVGKRRTK